MVFSQQVSGTTALRIQDAGKTQIFLQLQKAAPGTEKHRVSSAGLRWGGGRSPFEKPTQACAFLRLRVGPGAQAFGAFWILSLTLGNFFKKRYLVFKLLTPTGRKTKTLALLAEEISLFCCCSSRCYSPTRSPLLFETLCTTAQYGSSYSSLFFLFFLRSSPCGSSYFFVFFFSFHSALGFSSVAAAVLQNCLEFFFFVIFLGVLHNHHNI